MDTSVTRRADYRDVPAMVAMACEFVRASPTYGVDADLDIDAQVRTLEHALEQGGVWVAEVRGCLVGMIACLLVPSPAVAGIVASELVWWVEPHMRGTRIGLELLHVAEEWAKAQGATWFQMIAPADSAIGRLYARRGYTPLETTYQRRLTA